jgi:hypothetical protein
MNAKRFSQPVAIFIGPGSSPREIDSVGKAYKILVEWNRNRGPWHSMALMRCQNALANDADVEAARIAFAAFARARGILAPNVFS